MCARRVGPTAKANEFRYGSRSVDDIFVPLETKSKTTDINSDYVKASSYEPSTHSLFVFAAATRAS